MTDFLAHVANELYTTLDGHFEELTIVVPNKRTRLFLDEALARCAQPGRPLWAPEYATITELFASLSTLQPADELLSVVLLHQAYTQAMEQDETLEHFYAWGRTLLADFDDMDNNLVDVQALFTNLKELEQLTATDYLSTEQIAAVQQFFSTFHEGHLSEMKEKFLQLWKNLLPIYQKLHDQLAARGLAYPGMLKREVINSFTTHSDKAPLNGAYAFVGFHLLSKSEQALFNYLRQNAQRTFTFTDNSDGDTIPPVSPTIITAPTDNAQARYAGEWLQQLHLTPGSTLNRTAIVLCDEALLPPLLHSLPDSLPINVSMGFPLSQTPTGALINQLISKRHSFSDAENPGIELIDSLIEHIDSLGHQLATETLSSPAADETSTEAEALLTAHTLLTRLAALLRDNTLNLSPELLTTFIRHLISLTHIPFSGEPATGIQVLGLLETRNLAFDNLLILSANEGNLPRRTISHSFIPYHVREAYGMSTHEQANELYRHYFYRLLAAANNSTILFNATPQSMRSGEPSRFILQLLAAQQVVPGQLLALQSNMTPQPHTPLSIEKNDDILRILQQRYGQNHAANNVSTSTQTTTALQLSPSAINTYIDCSLKFYFHYVARIRLEDPDEEQVPDNLFGDTFHLAMEHIYKEHFTPNTILQATQLELLAQDEPTLTYIVTNAFIKANKSQPGDSFTGEQQLNICILTKYVQQQLRADAKLAPLTIHAAENREESYLLHIDSIDDDIKLGGVIDRRDTITHDGRTLHRIVDYKTSPTPHEASKIEDLFNGTKQHRPYHFLQALCYADIYTHNHPTEQVAPAIAYVKKETDHIIKIGKAAIDDYACSQFKVPFHELLVATINTLFDTSTPFTQTTQERTCNYCPYKLFCGRKKMKV